MLFERNNDYSDNKGIEDTLLSYILSLRDRLADFEIELRDLNEASTILHKLYIVNNGELLFDFAKEPI